MSLRTLRFGDRTISYDTGLNLVQHTNDESVARRTKRRNSVDHEDDYEVPQTGDEGRRVLSTNNDQADDGIGTSDDETNSNSSTLSSQRESNDDESSPTQGEEADTSPNLNKSRRVIKLDMAAISQLLSFDEEEEDEYEEEEEELEDRDDKTKPKDESSHKTAWHKTIAKDLANLSNPKTAATLERRHSITLCESRLRKTSHDSTKDSSESSQRSSPVRDTTSQSNGQFVSLTVAAIQQQAMQESETSGIAKPHKTLNLRLEEVAHIRSVLNRAELETLDTSMKDDIERGKVCFHCMRSKFGMFSRGQKCEMCKQIVCNKCFSKMRIPLEHFSATPVFALSPCANEGCSRKSSDSSEKSSDGREKKMSVPNNGLLNQSVGSAPSSPTLQRPEHKKAAAEPMSIPIVPTISSSVGFPENSFGPVSLPMSMLNNPYATLPKKTRRMSWMSPRDAEREKLEGSLLTVCTDCKDMVVEVIRVSRSSRRTQQHHTRSDFVSLTPDTVREFRT